MAITNLTDKKRGFALFIAIVFMSVMLLFGLSLSSISYKQQILASSSVESQYAFYASDAGLECALYAEEQQNLFAYPPSDPGSAPAMTCDGSAPYSTSYTWNASQWTVTNRVSLDSNAHCADVVVTKPNGAGLTTVFSQGYDVSCAIVAAPGNARFVSRGITSKFSTAASQSTFATWNPADTMVGTSLSNGNLTATKNVGGWGAPVGNASVGGLARATFGKSSGKWYWEVRVNAGTYVIAGISLGTAAGSYLGFDSNGWGWYITNNGNVIHSSVQTAFSAPAGAGTVLGFALDMGAGTLTGYKNGVLQGTIASGLAGSTVYPAVDMYDTGASVTVNFGTSAFSYTPPAGYNYGFYQ